MKNILDSFKNDVYENYICEIELFSVEELRQKYEIKEVLGFGCMISTYSINDGNYRCWQFDEISKLEKINCLIEKGPNGTKITSLDLKYQISEHLIKSIKQLRFDHFDFREGYNNFVGINELDGNDIAAIDMEEEWKKLNNETI